ncbi:MAG: hypothetical protein ABIQ95_14485 [Bdellovibrionia bacterium]
MNIYNRISLCSVLVILGLSIYTPGRAATAPDDAGISTVFTARVLPPRWPEITPQNRFWAEVSFETAFLRTDQTAIGLTFGYHGDFFGVDIRGKSGSTAYSAISVLPDDPSSIPESHVVFPRLPSDQWTFTTFEPGLDFFGSLFKDLIPLLAEKARVGIVFGTFADHANSMSFAAKLLSFEGGLIYRLGATSPFTLGLTSTWYFGKLTETEGGGGTVLPLSYVNMGLSLLYWF